MTYKKKQVVVIIPAHNEEQCIAKVVQELAELNVDGSEKSIVDSIIVCDNGSTDQTAEQARQAGAHVVKELKLGYGAACLRAMQEISGFTNTSSNLMADIVVFVDGDHSVLVSELPLLLDKLINGYDLVVGNRVPSLQESGALTPHQQFGNVLASALIRFIWKQPVTDLGPFRAITYKSLMQLGMQDQKFGWTVEMQVKAIQLGFRYSEVPVTSLKRIGVSKISGTIKGTIGAAHGIFGKVFNLLWHQTKFRETVKQLNRSTDAEYQSSN